MDPSPPAPHHPRSPPQSPPPPPSRPRMRVCMPKCTSAIERAAPRSHRDRIEMIAHARTTLGFGGVFQKQNVTSKALGLARSFEQELFDELASPGGLPSGPGERRMSGRRADTSKESSTRPSSAAMTRISASLVADLQKEKLAKAAWCARVARTRSHLLPTWTGVPRPR